MQAILIELIEHFEFSPAPGNPEIIRCATGFMSPMYGLPQIHVFVMSYNLSLFRVKGEPGIIQLPLTVTSVM